jgi:tRNA synthetases class II (A)
MQGAKPGFFHQLVPVVVDMLKGAFPELENRVQFVMDVLKDEETAFNKTLDKGLREFSKKAKQAKAAGGTVSVDTLYTIEYTFFTRSIFMYAHIHDFMLVESILMYDCCVYMSPRRPSRSRAAGGTVSFRPCKGS